MTPGLPREAGWLERQFESAANDYAELPDWMKRKRGANPMTTLDELLAKHPGKWTYDHNYGDAVDASGCVMGTQISYAKYLVEAVNRIGELQSENAELMTGKEMLGELQSENAELMTGKEMLRSCFESVQADYEELERELKQSKQTACHWNRECVETRDKLNAVVNERDELSQIVIDFCERVERERRLKGEGT